MSARVQSTEGRALCNVAGWARAHSAVCGKGGTGARVTGAHLCHYPPVCTAMHLLGGLTGRVCSHRKGEAVPIIPNGVCPVGARSIQAPVTFLRAATGD